MSPRAEFLPGIEGRDGSRPQVSFDAHSLIHRERRTARLQDVLDLILLGIVDWAMLSWDFARFPFLDRFPSLLVLLAINFAVVVWTLNQEAISSWRARRIASTWSQEERQKLARPISRK